MAHPRLSINSLNPPPPSELLLHFIGIVFNTVTCYSLPIADCVSKKFISEDGADGEFTPERKISFGLKNLQALIPLNEIKNHLKLCDFSFFSVSQLLKECQLINSTGGLLLVILNGWSEKFDQQKFYLFPKNDLNARMVLFY